MSDIIFFAAVAGGILGISLVLYFGLKSPFPHSKISEDDTKTFYEIWRAQADKENKAKFSTGWEEHS